MPTLDQMLDLNITNNIVGKIHDQLLMAITDAPLLEHKTKYIIPVLEELFKDVNWATSFEIPMTIVYDEALTPEILIAIHQWLRTKCADIENINLITTHHCGLARWWKQWCVACHEKSFSVVEFSYGYSEFITSRDTWIKIPPMPADDYVPLHKDIQYHFSYYGGTYPVDDRLYMLLRILKLRDHGIVEYIGYIPDKEEILNYAENITYFKNQKIINDLSEVYDQCIINNHLIKQDLNFKLDYSPVKNDMFFSGYQYITDSHCFANIIRETINFHPYTTVSEKTLRSFMHHLVVVPTTYRSVDDLETQGFWFPHNLIDYTYQYETDHATRFELLINSVKQMIDKFSIDDLNRYYRENLTHFHHNTKLVYDIIRDPSLTYRKLKQCDI